LRPYSAQVELDVTHTTELTIPKSLDRCPEHFWSVHKPPSLEPSSTRRRGFPALAVLPQRVGEAQLAKRCLIRHLTTLNVERPRGVCINGEETLPLHLLLSNNKHPFLFPSLVTWPLHFLELSYSQNFLHLSFFTVVPSHTTVALGNSSSVISIDEHYLACW